MDETYLAIQEWKVHRRMLAHNGLFFFHTEGEEKLKDRRNSNSQRRGEVKARSKDLRPRVARLCSSSWITEVDYTMRWDIRIHGFLETIRH